MTIESRRLLIVEDDSVLRERLNAYFSVRNEVCTASTISDGIALAKAPHLTALSST